MSEESKTTGGAPVGFTAPRASSAQSAAARGTASAGQGATFSYTFSAERREEVERIREKYLPREADPTERLREIDRGVTRKATVASISVGVVGSLVMGIGMCFTMLWATDPRVFIAGVAIGLAGIALVALAYPLYRRVIRREREKAAPEVMRITDELLR